MGLHVLQIIPLGIFNSIAIFVVLEVDRGLFISERLEDVAMVRQQVFCLLDLQFIEGPRCPWEVFLHPIDVQHLQNETLGV